MAYPLKKIISDYYAELNSAYKTKELNTANLHFSDDIQFTGTNEYFEGKESVISVYSNFIALMKNQKIRYQYFDHESCCSGLLRSTIVPDIQLESTERLVVSGGKIVEIYITYDTKSWHNLMQLLQNSNSSASFFKDLKNPSRP